MSEMTNRFSGSPSAFGILYPMHHLLALLATGDEAIRAEQELRAAGFHEDEVIVFPPHVFAQLIREHQEKKGLWDQFMETISRTIGTEQAYVDLDLQLADEGAGAVAVHAETEKQKTTAREILERFDPLAMRYYAHLNIEVYVEHSNTHTSAQQSGLS